MKFKAEAAELSNDGYSTVLALASDRSSDPSETVILSLQNEPGDQDAATGTAVVHIITSDGVEGYDLVRSLKLNGSTLRIGFDGRTIDVDLSGSPLDMRTAEQAVDLFSPRLA